MTASILVCYHSAQAQTTDIITANQPADSIVMTPLKKPFFLDITIGPSIKTGSDEHIEWFGKRQTVSYEWTCRIGKFFTRHWGGYFDSDLHFSHFRRPWFNNYPALDFSPEPQCGLGYILKITLGIGITYRFEHNRWQYFMRGGVGIQGYGSESWDGYLKQDDQNEENRYESQLKIDRKIGAKYANTGITLGYRVTKSVSWIFDINYRYPLSCSKVTLTNHEGEITRLKSKAWANDITLSIGIRIQAD